MNYRLREGFLIDVGFTVSGASVLEAIDLTNRILADLPASLYRSVDYKTSSAIVGSIFCEALAEKTEGIVNPIEKGHPDIVPTEASRATEQQLRNYPAGLEVKCTIGNIAAGVNRRAGQRRVNSLTGLTWQAHHRDVRELMGLTWDFAQPRESFQYPAVTGAFHADDLEVEDWGKISGTTGRNTKVSGMTVSGKRKMGRGWIALLDEPEYLRAFRSLLKIDPL
jgi:hypothetical protein